MTYYGQDYMLEDRTGRLTGSDFNDIHDRVRLTLRCTSDSQTCNSYAIYDRTRGGHPVAVLEFGPNNSLGTVSFRPGVQVPMDQYLVQVHTFGRYAAYGVCLSSGLSLWDT
jgi:hypothetical protein